MAHHPSERPPPLTDEEAEAVLFRRFRGWTFTERQGAHRHWSWQYGWDISNGVERKFACKVCVSERKKTIAAFAFSGLQNAHNHLFDDHRISAPEGQQKSKAELAADAIAKKLKSRNPESILHHFKLNPDKPHEQSLANTLINNFSREHFQRLVVEWIVDSNLPFSMAGDRKLRAIFEYLNPSVKAQKAHITANSVRGLAKKQFVRHKSTVVEALKKAPGSVHISFDGWRAPNRASLYGVVCFFRDESNKPCKITLGLPEVGRHMGTRIADEVCKILEAFGVEDKVGYAVLDNASNNDTAMEAVGGQLGFLGHSRRCRCIGHTINLAAKALLFGHNPDAFEELLSGERAFTKDEYAIWRDKGPVGKLHNMVVDIDRSDRYVSYSELFYYLTYGLLG